MKIGIVGLGLIGGSIFKRAKLEGFDTIAVSFSQAPLNSNQQEELGIFNDYQRLKDCDIVFVCSTIEKTPQVLEELNTFLTKDNIVCDVAC